MTKIFNYGNDLYTKRSEADKTKGFLLSVAAAGAILSPLQYTGEPFQKQLYKERINNTAYKIALEKALNSTDVVNLGVGILKAENEKGKLSSAAKGTNACYIPSIKSIKLNTEKACSTGFHELGHAMNHLKSFMPKYLQKMRGPGYAVAGLMEYFAIFSRTKPKDSKRNLTDFIEDNCGKIAFIAMLPTVIEEGIASYKGIKIARKSGLSEPLIKNLKKLYTKAFMTYASRAVLGSLAIGASRMIMDYYTRPKKVDRSDFSFFG